MVFKKNVQKFSLTLVTFVLYFYSPIYLKAKNHNFQLWLKNFKLQAIALGISDEVVNEVMADAKFLPKVIEYDRYQPEFYEDTFTYIKKRSSKERLKMVLNYIKRKKIIDKVEEEFFVEKEFYCTNGHRNKFWKLFR